MSLNKVYKTPVEDVVKEMSQTEQNNFIQEVIMMVRKNPNNTILGKEVDKYVKKVLK
jgi:hypothetical protein